MNDKMLVQSSVITLTKRNPVSRKDVGDLKLACLLIKLKIFTSLHIDSF